MQNRKLKILSGWLVSIKERFILLKGESFLEKWKENLDRVQ